MVDEVEIKNVGGFEGVASEATLLSLVEAIERQSKTQGAGASAAARAQQLYNRRITEATRETGKFTQAMKDAAAGLGRGAKEFVLGGRRVSDFSEAIFGASSSITSLTRYLDQNIDTWRSLASVGASFNNSIFDMISASANSGMEMQEFSNLVRRNSETLASFGGTVTQGARNLGEFSKNFRAGIGQQFFDMGFTIEDVNEGLVGFLDLQRRSSTQTLRFDAAQQQSAANYILQLDKLAKITGLQRSQIEDAMQRQLQDAGVRSQLNRLTGRAQDNLRETLAFLDTELQGPLADGLRDLMDGVAQTDLGRALATQVPGITEFAQRMFAGGATIDEVISELGTNFGPQLERMASGFSKAQLDQMRMSGGVTGAIAEILDSAHQLNRLTERDAQAAAAEQQRRNLITGTLGRFEDAIVRLRRYFVDLFFDASSVSGGFLDAMRNLGDIIFEQIEAPAGIGNLGSRIRGFMDLVFGPNGYVTWAIETFADWISDGGIQRSFDWLMEQATAVGDWFRQFWTDLNTPVEEGGGIWNTLSARWNDFLDYVFGEKDENGQRTNGKLNELLDSISGAFEGSFTERLINSALTFLLGEGTTTGNFLEVVQNKLMDLLYGPLVDVDPRDQEVSMQRTGGLLKTLADGFSNLLSNTPSIAVSIIDGFTSLFGMATTGLGNALGLPEGGTLWNRILASVGLESLPDDNRNLFQRFLDKIGLSGDTDPNSLWARLWARVGLDVSGTTTLWQALWDKVGIDAADPRGLWAQIKEKVGLSEDTDPNSLWARLWARVGLDVSGTTTLWQALWNRVGIDAADPRGLWAQIMDKVGLPETSEGTLWSRLWARVGIDTASTTPIMEQMFNKINDAIFGQATFDEFGNEIRTGGLIDELGSVLSDAIDRLFGRPDVIESIRNAVSTAFSAAIQGITNFWNDPANQGAIDQFFEDMTNMFQRVIDAIVTAIQGAIRGATGASATTIAAGGSAVSALGESIAGGEGAGQIAGDAARALLGFGTLDRDQFLAEAEGGALQSINAWLGDALGMGVDDWFRGHLRSIRGQHPEWTDAQVRDEVQRGLEQYISTNYTDPTELETMNRYMRESLIPTLRETSFAEGTNGFQNFGQGTLSMLHGTEAVVPRNSEAGELLQAFYDRQAQPTMSTSAQSMSDDKLDQLNNTMMHVASLLSQALGVQTRTMREVRAGGSDYFRSIGR